MDHTQLASRDAQKKASAGLETRRFKAMSVGSGKDALEAIKKMIPEGASVMNGSSVTLEEIGFVEYLKSGDHKWNDLHANLLKEEDKSKRDDMRKHAVVSDYYLGSVHALTEGGEMVIASNTGSQQPHLSYTSPNLILVVGAQKIVPDLAAAFDRLEKHVVPLEDAHMKTLYGAGTTVILVNEKLGF